MPYIEVIQPEQAEGELKEIYDDLLKSRGKIAEVLKIHSLNPKAFQAHMDLYMTLLFQKSPLRRYQREMIAVITSKGNQCNYCQTHHGAALNNFWKDDERIERLKENPSTADISDADIALCEYARALTVNPGGATEEWTDTLKEHGFNDRAILDATMIVAYFNFVNRIVMGLGVELETDEGKGYNYD